MNISSFNTALISENKKFLATSSLFEEEYNKLLKQYVNEEEEGEPAQAKQESQGPAATPEAEPEMPSLSAVDNIALTELAVGALFVEVQHLDEKHPEVRDDIGLLSTLKPISPEDCSKALHLLVKIVNAAGIATPNIKFENDANYSSQSLAINTAVNCLFASQNKIQNADPSIGPVLSSISTDLEQLKNVQHTDTPAAVKLSEKIQKSLAGILPTATMP